MQRKWIHCKLNNKSWGLTYFHLSIIKSDPIGNTSGSGGLCCWRIHRRDDFPTMNNGIRTINIHICTISTRILYCWVIHYSEQEDKNRRKSTFIILNKVRKIVFHITSTKIVSGKHVFYTNRPVIGRFGPIVDYIYNFMWSWSMIIKRYYSLHLIDKKI